MIASADPTTDRYSAHAGTPVDTTGTDFTVQQMSYRGSGSFTQRPLDVAVTGGLGFISIGGGRILACALRTYAYGSPTAWPGYRLFSGDTPDLRHLVARSCRVRLAASCSLVVSLSRMAGAAHGLDVCARTLGAGAQTPLLNSHNVLGGRRSSLIASWWSGADGAPRSRPTSLVAAPWAANAASGRRRLLIRW